MFPLFAILLDASPNILNNFVYGHWLLVAMLAMLACALAEMLIRKIAIHAVTYLCLMDWVFTYWILLSR